MARQVKKFPVGTKIQTRDGRFTGTILETGGVVNEYGREVRGARIKLEDGAERIFVWNTLVEEV